MAYLCKMRRYRTTHISGSNITAMFANVSVRNMANLSYYFKNITSALFEVHCKKKSVLFI